MTDITLYGRVFIQANIEALTGLHIGGSDAGMEIGGLDNAVIRNPLNEQPYIPGSSLRGKMRSQTEKILGKKQNNTIGQVTIHTCKTKKMYEANGGCEVCHVFGVPGEGFEDLAPDEHYGSPTRLVVRDIALDSNSLEKLGKANTDLPYAELKTEVAIDRVTSAAVPRTLERVPAGAVFGPAKLVFNIYDKADYGRLMTVIEALQLVEDDYLGGSGSRGSGQVRFTGLKITGRARGDYASELHFQDTFTNVQGLANAFPDLKAWLADKIPTE